MKRLCSSVLLLALHFSFVLLSASAARAGNLPAAYTLIPLDQPANIQAILRSTDPLDVNNLGKTVGIHRFWFGPSSVTRPVRWDTPEATAERLQGLSGGIPGRLLPNSQAKAVNDAGITVGQSRRFESDDSSRIRAVYWDADTDLPVELPTQRTDSSGDWYSSAHAITEGGLVGGQSYGTPVIWDSVSSIPTPLHFRSGVVRALNDSRQAGGHILENLAGSTIPRPVRWEADGTATLLDVLNLSPLGESRGEVRAINSVGDTVGISSEFDDERRYLGDLAVHWKAGETTPTLLSLPTAGFEFVSNSTANDLNESDLIVGTVSARRPGATNNSLLGVVWDGVSGESVLLDDLLREAPGWTITSAHAINQHGWIAAIATAPNDRPAIVLLAPIPEPTGAVLLMIALLMSSARPRMSRSF